MSDQILELDRQGLLREGIATQLGIWVASVCRVLKAARVAAGERISSAVSAFRQATALRQNTVSRSEAHLNYRF
jgi:hypothetical protein